MTVYNAILQILKRNKGTLLLGLIIMTIITFFYSGALKDSTNELEGAKVAVFDQDDTAISQGLIKQLKGQHELVNLEDSSQKGLDDALYFNQVDYILTIPKDFAKTLEQGELAKVETQTKPGTFTKMLVNTTINHYLNTYLTYQKEMPHLSSAELLNQTAETVEEKGTVHFDQTYHQKRKQIAKGRIFDLLAYGLFMTVFSGYAVINLAFNREHIRKRNSCAPVSRRKLSRYLSIGSLVYSFFCLIIFTVFLLVITKSGFDQLTGYFLLNILAFFCVMVAFSIAATSLVKSEEAISGINNVFIMGSCFVGGIFVPAELMPDIVNKIASFTPTYWFAQNNALIGKTVEFNQSFKDQFLQQTLILLSFAAVFIVLHLITMKEKGGLKTFSKKETVVLEK
ncbi:hypothetical protein NRIC_07750 [Enterococcus florum]|uniref:ABC-2 type transporter transmembrane domain-containing protein n=1 Tax=Enterococcus florum TaxID=2480627 RepID=A0A4P5P999_9ENTE|nr:ABC transporter permease [Enterococcus florum]GCF92884.1 hypothetical protein NRIC_07750 [Enterococcus florum]